MPFTRRSFALAPLLAAGLAALTAGCAVRPEIRHDQDPTVDLRSYKTFAFYEPAQPDTGPYTTLIAARLKQAARAELEKQHYAYSESHPDLRVNVMLLVVEQQELRNVPAPRGAYGYRGWGGGVEAVEVRAGTLGVDLVDARRNTLVWQGVAHGRVSQQATQDPGPAIDAAIGEIFAGFPGRSAEQAAGAIR